MYFAVDDPYRLVFFRLMSSEFTDEQWQFYADAFERYTAASGAAPYSIVVESEAGSAMPSAKWRKRFADIGARVHANAVFVLIAKSAVARGIVTAVNWLRPFKFHYGVVANRTEATSFVCKYRQDLGLSVAFEALTTRAASRPVSREGRCAGAAGKSNSK